MKMKEKCFADRGRFCVALENKCCDGCSFYQTVEQLKAGQAKAKARLLAIAPNKFKKYNHVDRRDYL